MTLRWENEKMVIQSLWEPFGQLLDDSCFDLVLKFRTRNTTEWQVSIIFSWLAVMISSLVRWMFAESSAKFMNPDHSTHIPLKF